MLGPLIEWAEITPSDGEDLAVRPRALDCAVGGTVAMVSATGSEATLSLTPGVPYPVRPVRIRATGTTATGIVGLW
ncbi:hypothetical protein BV392_07205 [Rhodovulum sulfidophilum]|nr:hypothetical protein BV392_07205 [Rhodovulum sulfidophilum]